MRSQRLKQKGLRMGKIAEKMALLLEIQAKLSPPLISRLNPPAHFEDIERAEQELGVVFPSDLRELLLCADGQPFLTEDVARSCLDIALRIRAGAAVLPMAGC